MHVSYKETIKCAMNKNMKSEVAVTEERVRDGGSLSPLLFITFMDEIVMNIKQRIKPLYTNVGTEMWIEMVSPNVLSQMIQQS